MRTYLVFALCVLFLLPIEAQSAITQSMSASAMLQAIGVRIDVGNYQNGKSGLCHGFVYTVRDPNVYVATAKHCVAELTTLSGGTNYDAMHLDIRVTYANGSWGVVKQMAWRTQEDAVVLVATFFTRPASWNRLCPNCQVYYKFGAQPTIPVVSLLSAGGGPPVVSSGFVRADPNGRYSVLLPAAPGTSGSGILDARNGDLVGIVVTVAVQNGTEAGWRSGIVFGDVVSKLSAYAIQSFEKK